MQFLKHYVSVAFSPDYDVLLLAERKAKKNITLVKWQH